VSVALWSIFLLLMMASWLRGRVLALLTLGYRGPRVAATSGIVAQHSQHSAVDGSYPPLAGLLRCAGVRARFLGAAFLLVRHLFFGASGVGVIW
jgi:hypothetical protein